MNIETAYTTIWNISQIYIICIEMLHRFIWKILNLSHPLSDYTKDAIAFRCDRRFLLDGLRIIILIYSITL